MDRRIAWDKDNTTPIKLKLNNRTDADILTRLAQVGNRQGYIKQLIRADIRREESKGE